MSPLSVLALVLLLLVSTPAPAGAYVGPGAGFVFITSFLVLFVSGFLAFLSLLAWPIRALWRLLRRVGRPRPKVRRLIVVGYDGQDPKLTDRFMEEGKLPNFRTLAAEGCYHRLASTFPSVSPVAWSSFSTGTHPAKHNIFDFLDRDRRTYMPVLSSTRIGRPGRVLIVGRWRIPLGKPPIRLLRRSKYPICWARRARSLFSPLARRGTGSRREDGGCGSSRWRNRRMGPTRPGSKVPRTSSWKVRPPCPFPYESR
jgi:hypothetical protein